MADAEGGNDANTSGTAMLDTTQDSSTMTTTQPKKWKKSLVKCIFALFGIGTLFPWNSFITAAPYFKDYKFANVSDDVDYKNKFTVYVGYANYFPYVIALFVALYIPMKHSQMATLTSAVVMGVSFLITVILAVVDSSQWPGTFFVITMLTILVFSVFSAVFQSGILAMAGRLRGSLQSSSIQSYFVGQAAGGTVVAITSLLSLGAGQGSLRDAAIGLFVCAVIVLFACVVSFLWLVRMKIIRACLSQKEEKAEDSMSFKDTCKLLWGVFKEIKWHALAVWYTFFVTLSVFPVILSEIPSVAAEPSDFARDYFVPLVCFFTFNLCDCVGSLLPKWFTRRSQYCVLPFVALRGVFIPLFVFCNFRPDSRKTPVLIRNDGLYIFLVIIFSLSNGFLKAVLMMDGPKNASRPDKAASMMIFFLIFGILCGIFFSNVLLLV